MSETTDLIKRLRESGLSQTEIAKRTGIPQPRLSRWESGDTPDAADDALKLKALVEGLNPAHPVTFELGGLRETDHTEAMPSNGNGPKTLEQVAAVAALTGKAA